MISLSIVQLFTHSSVTRGGAVQGLLLARALQEHGHRVVSFFHAPARRQASAAVASLIPYDPDALDIRWINMKHPVSYLRFRRWLQQEHIDIVHAHRNLALLFAYFSTLGLSSPRVVANRGTTSPLPNRLMRCVFHSRRVQHVFAVAAAVKESLVQIDHVVPDKISVVYGSFDDTCFYPDQDGTAIRQAFHLPPDAPLIVCIAAIDPRKGLHVLMHAARDILRTFPTAKFLVVGHIDDARYFRQLQNELKRLSLTKHVIFTGHRTDVPAILAAADITVNASTAGEGLTGALREALAMQKPIVCTAVCGNPELIRHGASGWLVEPGNASALATALLEALHHPEEAKKRAKIGYQWVMQHCTNSIRLQQVEQTYLQLMHPLRSPENCATTPQD